VLAIPVNGLLALRGLGLGVAGMAIIMTLFGAATFAQPAIGRAYLAGQQAAVASTATSMAPQRRSWA
jgi:hypothetical protein